MSISNKIGKIKKSMIIKSAIAVSIGTVVIATSIFSVAALNDSYTILVDDETYYASSFNSDPEQILQNANITVTDADSVDFDIQNKIITIDRAFDVSVTIDSKAYSVSTTDCTVADVLEQANVEIPENYTVYPSLDTMLTDNSKVRVVPLVNITIKADGETITEEVPQVKVREILDMYNIELGENDTTSLTLDALVNEDTVLEVDRIEYKTTTKEETVEYKVKETETDELYQGETEVVKEGKDGKKEVEVKQTYVNGELADEVVLSEKSITKSVTQEVLVGTKEQPQTSSNTAVSASYSGDYGIPVSVSNGVLYDSSGNVVPYSTTLTGSSTAYYAPAGALTATGVPAYYGGVAVNPNIIPYGTKMFIASDDGFVYGYATAVDTGGALMDGSALVDCYYPTYDECVTFGRRTMTVYILE